MDRNNVSSWMQFSLLVFIFIWFMETWTAQFELSEETRGNGSEIQLDTTWNVQEKVVKVKQDLGLRLESIKIETRPNTFCLKKKLQQNRKNYHSFFLIPVC